MKKLIYLLTLLMVLNWPALSQTTVINESFETEITGWDFEGNWFHEPGYIFMYYHPVTYDFDFWTISPEFQVPTTGGDLIINHFIDVYLMNVTNEKCEISVLHGDQEDVVWEYSLSDGPWGSIFGTDMLIPLDEFVGENVRIKMRSYGAKSSALWGWFIFDLNLTTFFNYDLAAVQLNGPVTLNPSETGTWSVSVKNLGLNTASDINLKLFSYKDPSSVLATANFNGTINPGSTGAIPINWSTDVVHNTMMYAVVEHSADQFQGNNRSEGKFLRINPQATTNVLVWDNDNGIETIMNPETGQPQQASTAIQKTLQDAGIQYSFFSSLPEDLSPYDIVIATMGSYCIS